MKTKFKYFRSFFFFSIGAVLFWFTFKNFDTQEIKETIKTIPLGWVFLSMLFGYLAYVFRGLRWFLLINPLGYKPKKSILIHAIAFGYLFNAVVPRSGEIVRCTALHGVTSIPVSKLFGHVLLERLIDFILLAVCVLFACILNYNQFIEFSEDFTFPESSIYYIILLIFILILIYKSRKFFLKESQLTKITSFLSGIKSGFVSIKEIKNKPLFTFYTILIWVCYFLMTIVCFYCFSETKDLNLGHGLFILVAGGFGMVMPTPAGIGSYHFFVVAALTTLTISSNVAAGFALVVHTSQMIMIIVTGLIALPALATNVEYKNSKKKKTEIVREDE